MRIIKSIVKSEVYAIASLLLALVGIIVILVGGVLVFTSPVPPPELAVNILVLGTGAFFTGWFAFSIYCL